MSGRHVMAFAVVVVGITALAGCARETSPSASKGASASTASPDLAAVHRLCDTLHRVPSERRAACCKSASESTLAQTCEALLTSSVVAKRVAVDASRVASCALAMEASLDGCDWVTPSAPLAPAACQEMTRGLQARGATCTSSLECAGKLHCAHGTCVDPSANGTSCGHGLDKLAASLQARNLDRSHPTCAERCNPINHECQSSPAPGASCFSHLSCGAGQICASGQCAVGKARGVGDPCRAGECEMGLVCRRAVCRERAKTGEACETDLDCAMGGCSAARTCEMSCSNTAMIARIHRKEGAGR